VLVIVNAQSPSACPAAVYGRLDSISVIYRLSKCGGYGGLAPIQQVASCKSAKLINAGGSAPVHVKLSLN
jgi:hypothetical protein